MAEEKREGELYRVLNVFGRHFELRYGYYEDSDRENPLVDSVPIYPDFTVNPEYTDEGRPFVTKMQDACRGYRGGVRRFAECGDCERYCHGEDLIGICLYKGNKR